MKNTTFFGLTAFGLAALAWTYGSTAPRVLAASAEAAPSGTVTAPVPSAPLPPGMPPATPTAVFGNAPGNASGTAPTIVTPATPKLVDNAAQVKGDLVIDFLGGVRGYVEPCG